VYQYQYQIHYSDGTGEQYSSFHTAINAVRHYRGLSRVYIAPHCSGEAWSVYRSLAARTAARGTDCAYDDVVVRVHQCEHCNRWCVSSEMCGSLCERCV